MGSEMCIRDSLDPHIVIASFNSKGLIDPIHSNSLIVPFNSWELDFLWPWLLNFNSGGLIYVCLFMFNMPKLRPRLVFCPWFSSFLSRDLRNCNIFRTGFPSSEYVLFHPWLFSDCLDSSILGLSGHIDKLFGPDIPDFTALRCPFEGILNLALGERALAGVLADSTSVPRSV